ncbi:MAG: UDP-3-O-(3-hydroxymyristoyl)glucosamine N-acyltransferase [Bacteroidaceae bacterium]|nr:UDP-3-O-(3-hydroxymyristoyl)glucosamine N-acyltransferase [Bacteroidaceae bacterium]
MEFTAKQIAAYIGGEIVGDENATVHTFAKIEEGMPGALSFLSNPKYTAYIYDTQSSIVLVNSDFVPEKPINATLIKTANAYESLAKLMMLYESVKPKKQGISSMASIAESATIGENVYIGPFVCIGEKAVVGNNTIIEANVSIGDGAIVGDNCLLYNGVTIYHDCRVGNRCILHAGSVVGSDGFGFAPGANGYDKIPQIGIAILEDDVEIGANTCIDRATMGATIIKRGVKLDNMVQIAHNVVIDEHTVMAAQCGVAGSTKVGSWCMVGGQTGISGHIKIGNQVKVGGHSAIANSVKDGKAVMGYPAFDHSQFARASVVFKKLPEMYREMDTLKKELESLKQQLAACSKA